MVAKDEIVDHVAHLIGSDSLKSSPSLVRLLQFCVNKALAGENDSLKESMIGILCFGRAPGYDTKADPIVRVSARRLRAKLDLFYESEGAGSAVRVDIPKGTYVPVFNRPSTPISRTVASAASALPWAQSLAMPVLVRQYPSGIWSANYSWLVVMLVTVLYLVQVDGHHARGLASETSPSPSLQRDESAFAKNTPSVSQKEGDLPLRLVVRKSAPARANPKESIPTSPLLDSRLRSAELKGYMATTETLSHDIRNVESSADLLRLASSTRVAQRPLVLPAPSPEMKTVISEWEHDATEALAQPSGQQELIASGRSTATHFWSSERHGDADHSIGQAHGRFENAANGLSSTFEPHF